MRQKKERISFEKKLRVFEKTFGIAQLKAMISRLEH